MIDLDHRGSLSFHTKEKNVAEMQKTQTAGTPWHLWVVGIIATLWNAMGAFDYVMTQTQNESYLSNFTPEQLAYFTGFPVWVVASWAIAVWGGVLGALLLLLKRKLAVLVFLVSLLAMVLTTFHNYILSNGMEIMGSGASLGFTAAIFVIAVVLYLYANTMNKRGFLR